MPKTSGAAASHQRMKQESAAELPKPAVSADQDQIFKTKVTDHDDVIPSGNSSTDDGKAYSSEGYSSTDSDTDFETESESEEENGARKPTVGRIPGKEMLTPEATILIFDWDDTLLPSTWIRDQGLRLDAECVPTDEQRALLDKVAKSVARMLQKAQRQGEVVIVTNAESGWIELSCRKFMPSLYPLLERMRTRTVSARSTFEQPGVASPFMWKQLAFEREVNRLYDRAPVGKRKNVISLGDSAHEREAVIRATECMLNCCTKSLKFVERPEPEHLLMQHEVMIGCMRHVAKHCGDLDLCISISQPRK